ncbi:condensation domain-containing protein [Kribbella sp. NPDC051770]|uniref:condensation domain-containing protein n=1 Tax=Kribbella sp. NPDC051770 TaxID=3155413 RepID=UPI0034366944
MKTSLWQTFALELDARRPGFALGPWFTMNAQLALDGPVDADRLAAAFHTLQQRHDVLRTVVPVGVHDFPTAALELVAEPALHVPVPVEAPVRLQLSSEHLTMHLHHLISDPATLWLTLTELAALYSGAELPPPPQYADYVLDETEQVIRHAPAAGTWWQSQVTNAKLCPQPSSSASPAFAYRSDLLSPTELSHVDQLTRTHRSTALVTLLAALAAATNPSEGDTLLFNTLFSKRDRPAWQQVLGPCIVPSVLAVPRSTGALPADVPAMRDAVVNCSRYARFPVLSLEVPSRTPFFEYVPQQWPTPYSFGTTQATVVGAAGPKDTGLADTLAIRMRPTTTGVLTGHFSGDGTDWTEQHVSALVDDFRAYLLG